MPLAAVAAAPFASAAGNPARSAAPADTIFVLIHGAWHGGWCWCWQKLAPVLQAQGYRVLTPTLTPLGAGASPRTRGGSRNAYSRRHCGGTL